MQQRLDVGEIEGGHIAGVVEDVPELAGVALQLVLGQLQQSQTSNVGDVVAGDAFGHGRPAYRLTGPTLTGPAVGGGPDSLSGVPEQFEFLSTAWIEAARAIRDEYEGRVGPPPVAVRMNQVITDSPQGTIQAHLDTSSARTRLELGHLTQPDLTVTTDYATAKALFVQQDPAVAMAAFLSGKIRVEGDMAKLLALQATSMQVDTLAAEVAARVKAITAP